MTYTWSASCSELALLITLELSFGVLENKEHGKLDEISNLNSHRPTVSQHKDNRISNQTTPLFQPCRHTKYEDAECSESRCLLPREAGLLWQQHPKPGAFVVPFADHLPLLISVAHYPSQLVFKRLSICIENKSEQLEPLTACLLDHVLLHVYVPTLLSVAAAKERCDEELLP